MSGLIRVCVPDICVYNYNENFNLMKNNILSVLICFLLFGNIMIACDDDKPTFNVDQTEEARVRPDYARGADLGWVTEMEKQGVSFYNSKGIKTDCFRLMKDLGMNAIRIRVWVDPSDGWCNKGDVVAKAFRAANLGMDVMIDFHYSDSWADPGQQTKPATWQNLSFEELNEAVANHTKDVLTALKNINITPKWVQVGNETGNGMLWDEGKASDNMANYTTLTTTGYDAVKEIFPEAKVIVHLQEGDRLSLYTWLFNGLKNNGGKWDVIGMSLYPENGDYKEITDNMISNIEYLSDLYNCEVMVCEVGMDNDKPEICNEWLSYLIGKTIENEKCLGIFYWEPQCFNDWNGYTKGAFDESGKPTEALTPFKY